MTQQKLKDFEDDEFDILWTEEGKGKLAGHVGSFVCRTKKGEAFRVKLEGSLSFLKECFYNYDLWEGKRLTVRYQALTKRGIPLFPIGVAIREDV